MRGEAPSSFYCLDMGHKLYWSNNIDSLLRKALRYEGSWVITDSNGDVVYGSEDNKIPDREPGSEVGGDT